MEIQELVSKFRAVFAGLSRSYGTYVVEHEKDNGKKMGRARTRHEKDGFPITDLLWEEHLLGKDGAGIGIVPIRDDSTAVFGAVDIDQYKGFDVPALAAKIDALGLPLVPCWSKSGGCHAYLFAKEPVPAIQMRARLQELAKVIGFPNSEIFPKQNTCDDSSTGNWINMPYFGQTRLALRPDASTLTAVPFLDLVAARAQEPGFFARAFEVQAHEEVIPDGPPCLQKLVQIGVSVGQQNNTMLEFAKYFKMADPENWRRRIRELNKTVFDPPMEERDIEQSVMNSVSKKTYFYSCSSECLAPHCNSAVCRTRKFGVGKDGSDNPKPTKNKEGEEFPPFPNLGVLEKLNSDPPVWCIPVNGTRVELSSEELYQPLKFNKRVMEVCHMIPPDVSRIAWTKMLAPLLDNVKVIDSPIDATDAGYFRAILNKFIMTKTPAKSKADVGTGFIWREDGKVWFRLEALMEYVFRNYKDYRRSSVASQLINLPGMEKTRWGSDDNTYDVIGIPNVSVSDTREEVVDATVLF